MIDFCNLVLPNKKNYFLLYKHTLSNRQLASPTFPCNIEQLRAALDNLIKDEKRIQLVELQKNKARYIISSKVCRFPDKVDVQLIEKTQYQSQIYIYSRSVYGYYDFNVNIKRVHRWIKSLQNETAGQAL